MTLRLALIVHSLVFNVTRATFTKLTLKRASSYQIIQSKSKKTFRNLLTMANAEYSYYEYTATQQNVENGKIDLYLHNNRS